MNPQELQELLAELTQAVTQVMQSGEDLSDEFQSQLAQTLNLLVERIDQAQQPQEQNAPPTSPNPVPPTQLGGAPSYDARLLWILAGRDADAFASYLRTFPTPATANLLSNPDSLNSTISQLSRSMPQGEHETLEQAGIPHSPLQSSNIWGAKFDSKTGKMQVRFQSGSEYEYDGVPENIYNAFIHGQASAKTKGENQHGRWWPGKNPSTGAAFHQYIRESGFNYRKTR